MPEDHSSAGYLARQFMAELYRDYDSYPCGGCRHHCYELWCEKYQRPPYFYLGEDWPLQRCVLEEGWNE